MLLVMTIQLTNDCIRKGFNDHVTDSVADMVPLNDELGRRLCLASQLRSTLSNQLFLRTILSKRTSARMCVGIERRNACRVLPDAILALISPVSLFRPKPPTSLEAWALQLLGLGVLVLLESDSYTIPAPISRVSS